MFGCTCIYGVASCYGTDIISVVLIDHQARMHDRKKIVFKQRKNSSNQFLSDCGETVYMCHSTSPQLKNANMIMGSPQVLSGYQGQVDFPTMQVSLN